MTVSPYTAIAIIAQLIISTRQQPSRFTWQHIDWQTANKSFSQHISQQSINQWTCSLNINEKLQFLCRWMGPRIIPILAMKHNYILMPIPMKIPLQPLRSNACNVVHESQINHQRFKCVSLMEVLNRLEQHKSLVIKIKWTINYLQMNMQTLCTSSNSVVPQLVFCMLYAGLAVGLSWIRIYINSAQSQISSAQICCLIWQTDATQNLQHILTQKVAMLTNIQKTWTDRTMGQQYTHRPLWFQTRNQNHKRQNCELCRCCLSDRSAGTVHTHTYKSTDQMMQRLIITTISHISHGQKFK